MARRKFTGVARVVKATTGTSIQRSRAVPPAEKAAFHQIAGAGRRRVRRPFLGLTTQDEDDITARFAEGLDRLMARGS